MAEIFFHGAVAAVGAAVPGAGIGLAFADLQKIILHVTKTIVGFKSTLKRLQSTIDKIAPIFDDLESVNKLLQRPENEIDSITKLLKDGANLVQLCLKIKSWNLYNKYNYSKKLQSFDADLLRFFSTELQAHQTRYLGQISIDVRGLNEKFDSSMREIVEDVVERLESNRLTGSFCSINSRCSDYSYVGEVPELIIGLDFPLEELKVMLLKENEVQQPLNSSSSPVIIPTVVLISAPPGCGKTTLANMVCRDSKIKEIFRENIFFVTVSKTVNIEVIVKTVFKQKGCLDKLLKVQSNEDAINQLGQLLKQIGGGPSEDPILLVLDDVWSPGLEHLLQKFKFKGIPGYKILVTSRFDPPGIQSVYRLKLLDPEDAKRLFSHFAFPPGTNHPHISDELVDEVVEACKGFPLALNVVALSLCGKREGAWKTTLDKWAKGKLSIFDSNSALLDRLKTSLDALDEEKGMGTIKECFLDLGSFPEDQRISATVLLDMCVELYDDLDEEGMYVYDYLDELATRNLLNLVPIRKDESADLNGCYCNGLFVTQHDMLRELAIHQCSQETIEQRKRLIMEIVGDGPSKEWIEKFNLPLRARLVSISTDDSFTSNWHDMQLPEAEVLLLNSRTKNYTLPRFMEGMNKLKVLIVTNYGFCPAHLNNFPVVGYLSSLKRIRLEHISISLPHSTAVAFDLVNLQKLSLIMCEIGSSLDNFSKMFPNLMEIEIEYCRDLVELPKQICDTVSLVKISITCCNELIELPEDIGRLVNLQSLRLNSCTRLERLPETIGCLKKLSLLDVSDCLSLAEMPINLGNIRDLKTLNMRGCWGLFELPTSVEKFENLTVFCDKQTASLWEFYSNVTIFLVKEDINLNWLHN